MEGYDASTYGDRFADVYDDWYDDPDDTDACIRAVRELTASDTSSSPRDGGPTATARVLELGVGTGRLAIPMAALGLDVTGLDASPAMLDRLRAKPGGERVTTVAGDMAGPLPDGPFDLVLVTRNTFFNLTSESAQQSCLRAVADVLGPTGALVVEAFVPTDDAGAGPRSSLEVREITADRVRLVADRHDPATGEAWTSHIDITADGIVLRPCHVRYLSPAGLDELAATAGLALARRWGSWDGQPFDEESSHHVSVYRIAG